MIFIYYKIALPILIFYIPIKLINQDKTEQKHNRQCLKVLKSDDHSCSICRLDYSLGDSLKILPCSTHHHFHSGCIKAWFKISSTCPLCRKKLGKIIDDIKSSHEVNSYLVLEQQVTSSQMNCNSLLQSNPHDQQFIFNQLFNDSRQISIQSQALIQQVSNQQQSQRN